MYTSNTTILDFSSHYSASLRSHHRGIERRGISVQRSYTPSSNVVGQPCDVALALLVAMSERAHAFLLRLAQDTANRVET